MIPLEQKLLDLNLTVMSHHLETTLSEAAGKNLSAAATLEWLADIVTGHVVFPRPSHGSSRRDLSNYSASEVHRDVNERDRILTRVGTGSIPERGKAS